MLWITLGSAGDSMMEANYYSAGFFVVSENDTSEAYWGNPEYRVTTDSTGKMAKFKGELKKKEVFSKKSEQNSSEPDKKWGVRKLFSGNERSGSHKIKDVNNQPEELNDSASSIPAHNQKKKKSKGRLSPIERVIPE